MTWIHKLAATVSVFVALSVSTACAEVTEEMADLVEGGLTQYAEVVGQVDACTGFPSDKIDALSARIAEWRHPGTWDAWSGTRDDYAEKVRSGALSAYALAFAAPCKGMTKMRQKLADKWVTDIEYATRTKE